MSKQISPNQIFRADGKNVFIEVMNSAFSIGHVLINFIEYGQDNKQTKKIPIYIGIPEFLAMAQDMKSGKMGVYQQKHKDDQYPYPIPEYTLLGGVSAEKLKKKGAERADGKALSRQFKIVVGKKFIFQAEIGPGHENEKGLIVPEYKTNTAEMVVKVPMDAKMLKEMFLITEMHIQAFITRGYINGKYDYKPTT